MQNVLNTHTLRQISIDDTLANYMLNICNETTEDSVDTCALAFYIAYSKCLLLRCIVLKMLTFAPQLQNRSGVYAYVWNVVGMLLMVMCRKSSLDIGGIIIVDVFIRHGLIFTWYSETQCMLLWSYMVR